MTASDDTYTRLETAVRAGAALVPTTVGDALRLVVDDSIGRRHAKVNAFAAEALEGVDVDLLSERIGQDEVATVFLNAAEAAAKSSFEQKRRALARVARNAILDTATLDESILLVGVLSQVEAPHIGALTRLAAVETAAGVARVDPGVSKLEAAAKAGEAVRVEMALASREENSSVLAVLRALGLALPGQTYDSIASYDVGAITSLGHVVLASLEDG